MALPVHILIIDPMHLSLLPMLQKRGFMADYQPNIKKENVYEIIGKYHGLILRSKMTVDSALLDRADKLRFIARAGAGMDQIDVQEVERRNIALINAPEGNRDAVAEHVIGMLLCMFNRIHWADLEVRNKVWNREGNRGTELGNKVVGLVGYGNMGRAVAKKLSGFGCEVIAYDKYHTNYGDGYARETDMNEIFNRADVLSLHVPLQHDTRKLVDVNYFNKFRKNIYVINTARGEILDLLSLYKALQSGKVLGACLDVLENEKLDTLDKNQDILFDGLISSEKVLFTPHVAGWSHESYQRINEVLTEKITQLVARWKL